MANAYGLRLDLHPAPGPGAARCDKRSARARRCTCPKGLQNCRKRTHCWIKTGGNVSTNDSDEVRELDEIASAIDAYYWAMQNALRRPAQNDNVPTKH